MTANSSEEKEVVSSLPEATKEELHALQQTGRAGESAPTGPKEPGKGPEEPPAPELGPKELIVAVNRLAEKVGDVEAKVSAHERALSQTTEILKNLEERTRATTPGKQGGLGEIGELLNVLGLDTKDEGGDMLAQFYKSAHESFDKVMIANLRKSAGLPALEQPSHFNVE